MTTFDDDEYVGTALGGASAAATFYRRPDEEDDDYLRTNYELDMRLCERVSTVVTSP